MWLRLRLTTLLLTVQICFTPVSTANNIHTSCLDYFLHGVRETAIRELQLSITSRSYGILCEMPGTPDGPVTMIVHNSLEVEHELSDMQTIGYQIDDRDDLLKLIDPSDDCEQNLTVTWNVNDSNSINSAFSIELLSGAVMEFRRNNTALSSFYRLPSGILHLRPSVPDHEYQAKLQSTPLRCVNDAVNFNRKTVFASLENENDIKILVDDDAKSIQFAFRIDRPNATLASLVQDDGKRIKLDLIEGYLLTIGKLVHPVGFVSDAIWHTLRLDLHYSNIYVDLQDTAINIPNFDSKNRLIKSIEIGHNFYGEITAVRFDDRKNWFKRGGNDNRVVAKAKTAIGQPMKLCSYTSSFCKCLGSLSALPINEDETLNCQSPDQVDPDKGFHFSRHSGSVSFFHVPGFEERSSISMVFNSNSETGLLIFGVTNKNSIDEKSRVQVHFINEKMTAKICTVKTQGTQQSDAENSIEEFEERCKSCEITRQGGFASGKWFRVSLFGHNEYKYLALNNDICQLGINNNPSESADMYNLGPGTDNVLLIGGMLHTKTGNGEQFKTAFVNKFLDNTREKAPSLRGCIMEIAVNQKSLDLEFLFAKQVVQLTRGNPGAFSMKKGCANCVEFSCGSAPCRILSASETTDSGCDCSAKFQHQIDQAHSCARSAVEHRTVLLSSTALGFPIEITTNDYFIGRARHSKMQKLWIIFRPPTQNKEFHTMFKFGTMLIQAGENGQKIRVIILARENRTFDFTLQTGSEHEHILVVRRKSTIGTAAANKVIQVQVDNFAYEYNDLHLPFTDGSRFSLYPLSVEKKTGPKVLEGSLGCLTDIGISYEIDDEAVKYDGYENQAFDVDFLATHLLQQLENSEIGQILLSKKPSCGARNEFFWLKNATKPSPHGLVGAYDPYGVSHSGLGRPSGAWWILLVVLLAALIAITVILIILIAFRRSRNDYYDTTVKTNKDKTYIAAETEPLNGYKKTEEVQPTPNQRTRFSDDEIIRAPPPQPINRAQENGHMIPHKQPLRDSFIETGFAMVVDESPDYRRESARIVRRPSNGCDQRVATFKPVNVVDNYSAPMADTEDFVS